MVLLAPLCIAEAFARDTDTEGKVEGGSQKVMRKDQNDEESADQHAEQHER